MIGDIFIEFPYEWNLTAAAINCAIGHIFYSIAFCYTTGVSKKQIIPFFLCSAFTISYILFVPYIHPGDMIVVAIIYCIIISFMVSCALSLWDKKISLPKKLCIMGAIIFLISDFILLHELFITSIDVRFLVFLNTITYYPAQILVSLSLVDPFKKKDK